MTKEKTPLGGLLKKIIDGIGGTKGRLTAEDVAQAWRETAGEAAASHSKPMWLRRATLIVHVDNSAWLYELTVRKKDLAASLAERIGKKIKDIRFRIGDL